MVDHDDPFIAEASALLADAGGKRFRPLLTLLAPEVRRRDQPRGRGGGHRGRSDPLASLYHDDVMDEADVRRGAPSANAKYDNSTAILVDLLFDGVLDHRRPRPRGGQDPGADLRAALLRPDPRRPACPPGTDPVEYYLGVLADKTGVLIATPRATALCSAAVPSGTVETLRVYGERLGMAFQLADDLIDIASEAGETGETPGTDLREGKRPCRCSTRAPPPTRPTPGCRSCSPPTCATTPGSRRPLPCSRAHPAMERAREHTFAVAREAQDALAPLPDGEAKEALLALATGVVTRAG